MTFGHRKLDVYRVALEYVAWVYSIADRLTGHHRSARDQILRASQSIVLNIAEGNAKTHNADRNKFLETAKASALECSACQDILVVGKAISQEESEYGDKMLERIVSMLMKMIGKKMYIREEAAGYGDSHHAERNDSDDYDCDYDYDCD